MFKIFTFLFLFLIVEIRMSAATYAAMQAKLLDVGATSLTLHNSGTGGSDIEIKFSPGVNQRVRFAISTIYVPPDSGTTYTACAAPCTVNINRNWGQQYYWIEYVDNTGAPLSPVKKSQAANAYITNTCGGLGTLAQVELATVTTDPLPMPIEVIGQDCYMTRVQSPLISGHASTSLRLFVEIHNPGYKNELRPDGKIRIQPNSATPLQLTNSAVSADGDEQRYYSADLKGIGSFPNVRRFTLPVVDGTIGGSDTTVTTGFQFRGTEGNTSGARILAFNYIEANKSCTQIAVTSNVATMTCASHGYSNGQTVLVQNAPGMYMRFNGFRVISNVTTNTFDFTPCGTSTAGCTSPNGTYTVPVNRNLITYVGTTQPVMYAARCIIAKASFTEAAMPSSAPGGADAVRGEKLFKFGQASGVAGTKLLRNPVLPYLDPTGEPNTLFYGTCGGARGCHPSNGSDLKIFNYSNYVIKQRSIFHGLTDQDGDDIAAYIRGINTPVPLKGRPWNPPMQPGPGLSVGTWWKANSTLTNIAVTSNVATATFASDPGLITGSVITVWGGTVDTDINNAYAITGGSGTTRTFATTNVADGTYTEAGLGISTPIDFFAGCGIECVLTYGYADLNEYLAPGGSTTNWPYDKRIEYRDIPIPWQFGDWNQWLPVFFPGDIFPQANPAFLDSGGYTNYRSVIDNTTRNNFSSFATNNYCELYSNGGNGFQAFMNAQGTLTNETAGVLPPSHFSAARFSVQQFAIKSIWECAIEKQTFQFNGLYTQAIRGGNAYPSTLWPIANGFPLANPIFDTGQHRISVGYHGFYDGLKATSEYQSNVWYIATEIANPHNGWDTPQSPLDNAYYNAFLKKEQVYRPTGDAGLLYAQITSPQAGNVRPNMFQFSGEGTDWTAMWSDTWGFSSKYTYYWYTTAEWTARINSFLDMLNTLNASRTATYWNTTFTNAGFTSCCNAAIGLSTQGFPGAVGAYYLTMFTVWGADSTKITTLKTWLESISSFSGHNFGDDITAANQGATANGATGDLSVAGANKQINFTACPFTAGAQLMPMVISSTGGELSELLFASGTGPTPCVSGAAGTVLVDTIRNHTGTISVTYGCKIGGEPNQNAFNDANTRWWTCSNML